MPVWCGKERSLPLQVVMIIWELCRRSLLLLDEPMERSARRACSIVGTSVYEGTRNTGSSQVAILMLVCRIIALHTSQSWDSGIVTIGARNVAAGIADRSCLRDASRISSV